MELPKNWDEISLEKYLEIIELESEDLTQFDFYLEKLCILSDDDSWQDEEYTVIYQTINENKWLNLMPTSFKEKVGDYIIKPLNKLTLAEWIDLDKFISKKEIAKIIALLYRKTSIDKWGEVEYEPYQYSVNNRLDEFLVIPVNDIIGYAIKASEYRMKVLNNFSSIFSTMDDSEFIESEEDKQYLTPAEIEEQRSIIKLENERKKYSWEYLLNEISNGDWSRTEEILELPAIFVFNMMSMKQKFNIN